MGVGESGVQMLCSLNLKTVALQGEHYLKKRKKSNSFSGMCSVHIEAIVTVQVAVFGTLRFQFCEM